MRLLSLLLIVSGQCLIVQSQKTYYMDRSCVEKEGFGEALGTAFKMAKRTLERLESDTDTDFAVAYERLFGVKKDDPVTKVIKGRYEAIVKMVELKPASGQEGVEDWFKRLKKADIRLFCDNDAIYEGDGEPDYKTPGKRFKKKKNSDSAYYDFKNYMFAQETPLCVENGNTGENAYTSVIRVPPAPDDYQGPKEVHRDQNKGRIVVSFCDMMFQPGTRFDELKEMRVPTPLHFDDNLKNDLRNNYDFFEGNVVEHFKNLIGHIILHELVHAVSEGDVIDVNGAEGYLWYWLANKFTKEEQQINAENFGTLAILADEGYTIRRFNNFDREEYNNFGEEEKEAQRKILRDRIIDGEVVKYDDITKRALRLLRYFRG